MSVINKPGSIEKGVVAEFTLSCEEFLEIVSEFTQDDYFKDVENWSRVNFKYKSSPGSQYEIVEFDAQQATPTGNFLVSPRALDTFLLLSVDVLDFDGGMIRIPRSYFTEEAFDGEFDVSFSLGQSVQDVVWDEFFEEVGWETGPNGYLKSLAGGIFKGRTAYSSTPFGVGSELTFKIQPEYAWIGFDPAPRKLTSDLFDPGSPDSFLFNYLMESLDYPKGSQGQVTAWNNELNYYNMVWEDRNLPTSSPPFNKEVKIVIGEADFKLYFDGVLKYTHPRNTSITQYYVTSLLSEGQEVTLAKISQVQQPSDD
jgi:hypothetical protein